MNYIELEFKLDPLLPAREVLIHELGEAGYESFVNTEKGVKAYISVSEFDDSIFSGFMTFQIPDLKHSYHFNEIEQQNWNKVWESDFEPIVVSDKLCIRAPFHEEMPGMIDVLISPKMSFGTGHHQTTYMMSQALLEYGCKDSDVLDMGCGTAVLAILASKLGANRVVGIDIEDFAYENALENVKLNHVRKVNVYKGGAELLNSSKFHLILANINRNILLSDMEAYMNVLHPGGRICFSGFYTTDFDVINQRATDLGLVFEEMKEKEGWALLSYLNK